MSLFESIAHRTKDDAGCTVWMGACCNGHPATRVGTKTMLIRRLLWVELNGPIPAGHVVKMSCETPKCIEPEHITCTTYKKIAIDCGARGIMSGPVRSAAIARTKRKTQGKLDDVAVRDIRNSSERLHVLADRHGVSMSHVSKVQKYKVQREFSSPFAGLGARA